VIYANAQTALKQPRIIKKLVTSIDELDWYSAKEEGLGDMYEGLLEKNAGEKKSGAGQYFTPRVLIDSNFAAFEACYGEDANGGSERVDEGETGRFRCFDRAFVAQRGEDLDISWLRDESLQSAEDLPEPDAIASAIMEKLQIAMAEMKALSALLEE
jgi:hypothetical protein